MKREPTVADKFLAVRGMKYMHAYDPRALENLQRSVRQARKFVFDDDAVRRLAHVVMTIPELLVREYQFARPPYDLTWIEFNASVYWEEFRKANPAAYVNRGSLGQLGSADKSLGYLIDHGRVNIIVQGTVANPNDRCFISPLQYRLNTEWTLQEQLEFARVAGLSRMQLDEFMWGSTYSRIDEPDRRLLRAFNMVELMPMVEKYQKNGWKDDGSLQNLILGSAGELRTVIAMLLMLNRPSITRYVQTLPNSRGWHKGKVIPYMAHTHVTIDLDAIESLRYVGTKHDEGTPKRRHEVRGHFCHDKVARDYSRIAGCIHSFRATDPDWKVWRGAEGEAQNWVCSDCGGKRWWRREHARGDAGLGWVDHENYQVTA